MKINLAGFILLFLVACENNQSASNKKLPDFNVNKNRYVVVQPLTITGINEFYLDPNIIKKNDIKQYICYIEYNDISFLSEAKYEWRKYSSCTFDTTGNWADSKLFDYSTSAEVVTTAQSNSANVNSNSGGYWKGDEYFYKGDSMFNYQKYQVINDTGYIQYDSIVMLFKEENSTYVSVFNNDTVIHKSTKSEPYKEVFYRNATGQIIKGQKIDKRGTYEVMTCEYLNNCLVKVIKQNIVDMTESIYIDVIEYNDLKLPVNFKCYALENSSNAISEYNSGLRKANKIIELKVEWLK